MNNVEYHRQYFRSLWREKLSTDNFDRVVTIPETAPLIHEITPWCTTKETINVLQGFEAIYKELHCSLFLQIL